MTNLHVIESKTPEQKVRDDVLTALDDIIKIADKGDVDSVCIIASHLDGSWTSRTSKILNPSDLIVRLEMVRLMLMDKMLDDTE